MKRKFILLFSTTCVGLQDHHQVEHKNKKNGGEFHWWKHVSAIKTESHCRFLSRTEFPMSLPLHIILYPEQNLNDGLLYWVFHVTPPTNAACYQKVKCLIKTEVTGQGTMHNQHASYLDKGTK